MDSEEIFAEILRKSPPNPFAVRHTRPRRPTRARPHPAVKQVRGDVWALVIAILFLAVGVFSFVQLGSGVVSYMGIMLSVMLFGLFGLGLWCACAIRRCPRCHFHLLEDKPIEWCRFCGHLVQGEQLTKELEPWMRSHHTEDLASSEGRGVKSVGLLLWRMIIDEVDELALLPGEDDYRMVALVDGQEVELEPPPSSLYRPIVSTVRAIWGNSQANSPLNAVIQVHTDERLATVEATITPTPAGDSIRFQFSYPDDISTDSPTPQPAAMV